ncbi:MAG TPA: ATP-binding cassette domain-containing protein, partial [Oceanipulchritudo sp.]|nr:ATP-binding cassette domain-containing protein [Oceanipulchritudo sp.]
REPADAGLVKPGYQVDIGYFAQDQSEELDPKQNVFQAASAAPVMAGETHIRSVLGAFLFSGDDMSKSVSVLSGGEKNRLALARLLLCPANFLILDEPTNHLDMASKEVLKEALAAFPGTTFVVSHDRHFLNPVVNKILEIQPGSCRVFPGNLDDYLWKIDQERATVRPSGYPAQPSHPSANASRASSPKAETENPKERRRRQAQRQEAKAPLKKRLSQLEEKIASLEEKIGEREKQMADKAFFEQGSQTATLMREYDNWKSSLAECMEGWERTASELEELSRELDDDSQ